jgi:hypothetical protein
MVIIDSRIGSHWSELTKQLEVPGIIFLTELGSF